MIKIWYFFLCTYDISIPVLNNYHTLLSPFVLQVILVIFCVVSGMTSVAADTCYFLTSMSLAATQTTWICQNKEPLWYVHVAPPGYLFSHKSRFESAMTNCKLRYLNYRVYTQEKRLRQVCGLAFQSREKKRGSLLCSSDMLIDISFEKIRKLMCGISAEVVRRSCYSAPQITI